MLMSTPAEMRNSAAATLPESAAQISLGRVVKKTQQHLASSKETSLYKRTAILHGISV